ncbi:MAG TPA: Uma2 family endonuclease [Candidatus Acidoferrales bacterium]|jgi:Uma2 family endonuclease|nr:Uma2 family endonuclease [Candidatus Acidoferrales bacterium]
MSTKTLLTADELEQMPGDDSVRLELDEGELITMPPAGFDHGDYGENIALRLGNYVKKHRLGKVIICEVGFRLRDDTVRAPDVSFIRRERVQAVRHRGFGRGAPDLAVEIFSPSDSVRQLMRKVKQYFAAGCHTVWIFYPEQREVNVLEATGADRLLQGDDLLEAPELLPGFSVPVSEFFEE